MIITEKGYQIIHEGDLILTPEWLINMIKPMILVSLKVNINTYHLINTFQIKKWYIKHENSIICVLATDATSGPDRRAYANTLSQIEVRAVWPSASKLHMYTCIEVNKFKQKYKHDQSFRT